MDASRRASSVGFQGREEIASLMRASGDYHPTLAPATGTRQAADP